VENVVVVVTVIEGDSVVVVVNVGARTADLVRVLLPVMVKDV